jgi:glycosyltransferase involved in cell wall biosynthesis
LKEQEIDVLIACGALFFPIAVRACKGTHVKCICWEHTDPNTGSDYRFQRLARSYGAKRSSCNVVLTKRAQKFYEAHYPKARTVQIYNPIDHKVLENAGEYRPESKKIISVGRLTYQKYFQMAVEIAAEILPMHPDWQWDIYGDGEERQELEQLIAEKGLTEQMHLMGQVSDLYNRYREYAIMVMTSRYEGFPMSLLEGMGNGLPLVSFDIDTGPDEIIRDGENGYLIPASNRFILPLWDGRKKPQNRPADCWDCPAGSRNGPTRSWMNG